jgi:hypothetical protein
VLESNAVRLVGLLVRLAVRLDEGVVRLGLLDSDFGVSGGFGLPALASISSCLALARLFL